MSLTEKHHLSVLSCCKSCTVFCYAMLRANGGWEGREPRRIEHLGISKVAGVATHGRVQTFSGIIQSPKTMSGIKFRSSMGVETITQCCATYENQGDIPRDFDNPSSPIHWI